MFFALRRGIGIVKYIFIQRLREFRGLAKTKYPCAGTVAHTYMCRHSDAHNSDAHNCGAYIHVQAQ
jgi:hypothetical protein